MVGFYQRSKQFCALTRRPAMLALRLIVLSGLISGAAAAEVSATLTPESVPAGEGAQLKISITDGNATRLTAPTFPDGLIVNGPSQGRQMSIINGVRTSSVTLTYEVGSKAPGAYAIPPFTVTVDGADVTTQPLKLTVTPSAAQAPSGLAPGTGQAPSAPPPAANQEESLGFLTVELAGKNRKHAWVGEIAPVRIKAWLPADSRVSLNSPLQPEGSAFTLQNVSPQPEQDVEVHNGKRYLVATWYAGLSATKAGTSPPDLSMKISVQVPDPNTRGRRTGDPLFDRFFGRMIQKEVVLRTKTDEESHIEIRALPEEGRPPDFEGAVGRFAFGKTAIPGEWKTGEPQQISADIEGEGNFHLLQQPVLKSDREWKSYDGQSQFTAKDAASFSGTSSFRFSQVPLRAGPDEVRLAFSYFDPDTASYQTVETPPNPINITGTDLPPEPETAAPEIASAAAPQPPGLAPQKTGQGFSSHPVPSAWRPAFKIFAGLAGVSLLLGWLSPALRHRLRHPERLARAAHEKAMQAAMEEAGGFAARGDVPGFFAAARRALQVRLAGVWHRPAPAITLADVTRLMPPDSPVISFFQEADRQEFSRANSLPASELAAWRTRLEQAVKSVSGPGHPPF